MPKDLSLLAFFFAMNLAHQILNFYQSLAIPDAILPNDVHVLHPWQSEFGIHARQATEHFYKRFYSDINTRVLLLGINPGRFGAGITGIPFTDSKQLNELQIPWNGPSSHEPSSVFIYEMIDAFGGPVSFYNQFYFSSVSPLGFVKENKAGRMVNFNYYDDPKFAAALEKPTVDWLKTQIDWGLKTEHCLCIGTGKNFKYLQKLNHKFKLFDRITSLPHPRYVMQYKFKEKDAFIQQWVETCRSSLKTE